MRRFLGIISAAPSIAPVQFDPLGSDAGFTFSNANLTATRGVGGDTAVAIANASRSTGKYFFSVTIDTSVNSANCALGLATADFASAGYYLAKDVKSVGYWGEGYLVVDDDWVTVIDPFVEGDVVDIAVDLDAGLIWGRVNGGDWNASASDNPATGVGGKDIAVLELPLFPAVNFYTDDGAATANFGASAYTHSPPSGFANFTT